MSNASKCMFGNKGLVGEVGIINMHNCCLLGAARSQSWKLQSFNQNTDHLSSCLTIRR